MHTLYVILLLKMFQTSHATSGDQTIEKGSSSAPPATESPDVLPLTLIDLGGSCINPTKIEADWINKGEQQVLGGGTKFSAEIDGELKFMCANKPSSDSANTTPSNDQNCTYPMKFEKTDQLKCFHEPEPVISELKAVAGPISVIPNVRCGQGGRGKMYRYVYKICMTENPAKMLFGFSLFKINSMKYRSEFEVYRFCFDEQENAVVYTEHRIYSPNLLNDPALGEEQKRTFETISGNYGALGQNPDGSGRIFKWTTVPNETQINSGNVPSTKRQTFSKNQKLVPPEDFAFALWKKPTYDHLNSKKMRSDRTTLWDHINKIIRDDAIFHNREYYIKTQAFKMTMAQANLQETNISEPHIWMKKVFYFPNPSRPSNSYKNKAIVVLMVTESTPEIDSEMNQRCVDNLCPDALKESYFYVGNFIYCCSMITNEALSERGVKIDEDLDINSLTNINRGTKREREDDTEETKF